MPTKIEYADETWSPVTGCSSVSEGCVHCWAHRMSKRLAGRHGYPAAPHNFDVTLHPDRLERPLRWRKPRRIFVCSMGDLFHPDIEVLDSTYVRDVFAVMALAHRHTFLLLTKRPYVAELMLTGEFAGYVEWAMHSIARDLHIPAHALRWPLSNVWLGVTAENQKRADERIPILLQIPAAVHYVSLEPMLSAINLIGIDPERCENCGHHMEAHQCYSELGSNGCCICECQDFYYSLGQLDWIICGGESGPGARPVHPDWVRGIRDQCQKMGVPFLFKQWGAWAPVWNSKTTPDGYTMMRLGKQDAGRKLDGKVWNEYPETK